MWLQSAQGPLVSASHQPLTKAAGRCRPLWLLACPSTAAAVPRLLCVPDKHVSSCQHRQGRSSRRALQSRGASWTPHATQTQETRETGASVAVLHAISTITTNITSTATYCCCCCCCFAASRPAHCPTSSTAAPSSCSCCSVVRRSITLPQPQLVLVDTRYSLQNAVNLKAQGCSTLLVQHHTRLDYQVAVLGAKARHLIPAGALTIAAAVNAVV